MAMISIKSFGGIVPKVPARYLPETKAQTALNTSVFTGSLKPLANVGATLLTLSKVGTPKTIYRFGQDTISDTQYWFEWITDVNVCRSQISGDTSEWTFFTGDGEPKATYNSLALSSPPYPAASRPLGLKKPSAAVTVSNIDAAGSVFLSSTIVSNLAIGEIVGVKLSDAAFVDVTIVTATATAIATLIATISGVTAVEESGGIRITRNDSTPSNSFSVRYQTDSVINTEGTFTYDANLDESATGESDTSAYVVISDVEIGSVSSGDVITIRTDDDTHVTFTATGSFSSASDFATAITSTEVLATAYGSCVVLTPGTEGGGASDFIEYKRTVSASPVTTIKVDGAETGMPATLFFTQTDLNVAAGKYLAYTVNGGTEIKVPVAIGTKIASLTSVAEVTITKFGISEPFAVLSTTLTGTLASLRVRAGDYPLKPVYETINSDRPTPTETRVYTFTWVNKESGFEFESAPAPSSNEVTVLFGETVDITNFPAPPSGYVVTHKRIYRATAGIFLFVAEITAATASYNDAILAENLGEELPSLTWEEPPTGLSGLTNLPNGNMAGFVGRDIYFCEPYRPFAWPLQYVQSIDFPVVGLGRLDTTLVVLTTGTPYFIQGTAPESMVVVKSDLEQACASKRSIVSFNGIVMYASPDGLVALTPGGSKLITQDYFTKDQWQAFKPDSIHAYQTDLKYVAFYDTGSVQGGFVYDTTSGEFITHNVYATAGYTDIQRDKLFLAFSDRTVKVWEGGSALTYTWKSKKFGLPYPISFSTAQVQAETYPLTAKFYSDNVLMHTQTVANRGPFRLPALMGLDWEVQLEGTSEVFAVEIAQSPAELASV